MDDTNKQFDEEPGVFEFEDDAAVDAAAQRALADFDAGRVVSNEAVKRWLLSLSTANPLPRPKWGE